ncbi:acyltransferase family protein [Acidiferrobacter thiooxydans]|uniref:Acyltransferase n=1 Tax=Acidiferrobacter thiooxydans TaxID=163359 RepID=A0A1C2G0Q6_9GAMM|nr:acyltransferase [Acidiferrobacter thiooxydans]RCN55276.1 acyltransferase [Acidiferrobacter thiooxydans]RCN55296.1 acyltransferase [Acidiferrobacter thiooxydans]RCN55881.1 acyltransferase [Acidiferrobacter thiooxydans]UEN98866.1 acyltransferase [Acidiferrobacter thiooxydans]
MADGRVRSLDATRGLAAVSVVLSHYVLVLADAGRRRYAHAYHTLQWLSYTPLGLAWAGRAAVVFFFVLSGYVLYIMWERGGLSYGAYLKKRVVRLYLPYAGAVILGILGAAFLYTGPLPGLGPWINKFWSWSPNVSSLWEHAGFVDAFNSDRYDFTIWTLVQEMRVSLIFPLIVVWVRRSAWTVAWLPFAALAVATIFVRGAASAAGGAWAATVMGGGLTAYSDTVYYLAPFALGALLACHRDAVKRRYLTLSSGRRLILGVLAFALYFYGSRTLAVLGDHRMLVHDWPTMMGAALGLVVIAYEPAVKALLDHRVFQYLGRISYSLYLFHPLVLLAALHLFYGHIALAPLLAGTFVATLLTADMAYRWLERPAARMARALGEGVTVRRTGVSASSD